MEKNKIKIGAKVKLNSGGPEMIIDNIINETHVECVWMVKDVKKSDKFHVLTLTLIEPIPLRFKKL